MSLMSLLALCISACSSQADEDVVMTSTAESQNNDRQWQINEVAKHIKFDTDSFYLDITLEDAKQKGVEEDIYNKWNESLKKHSFEAREFIEGGGNLSFVNGFVQNKNLSRVPNPSGIYSDILEYPEFNTKFISIPTQDSHLKGVNFFCNALFYDENGSETGCGSVWHKCYISGYKKGVGNVSDGRIVIGTPIVGIGPLAFPGDIGDDAEPHIVTYIAEPELLDEGVASMKGYCQYLVVNELE